MSKDRLRVGEFLGQGESIISSNGKFRLTNYPKKPFELEEVNPVSRLFGVDSQEENLRLCIQDDGNVVLYNKNNKPIWNTKTAGQGNKNTLLIIDDNGKLVVRCDEKTLWSSGIGITDRLNAGESWDLRRGYMSSPNGKIRLLREDDGSPYESLLVLRDEKGGQLWMNPLGPSFNLTLGMDDNLIATRGANSSSSCWRTWTKNPTPSKNAVFQILDEGAAVLKAKGKILWSTDLAKFPPAPWDPEDWKASPAVLNRIEAGQSLSPGRKINSWNQEFSAVFQEDGKWVVIYNPKNLSLWSVQVADPGAILMCLDYDNNIFFFDKSGKQSEGCLDVSKQELYTGGEVWPYGRTVCLDEDGHLYSVQGSNYGWDRLDARWPWCNRLWFPCSKDKNCSQLFPGQCLVIDQYLSIKRGADSATLKYGLNDAGDFILILNDKTTYFRTGPHESKVYYLKFLRSEIQLVGAADKVLWAQPYREPHGFTFAMRDPDPPVLKVEFYGDLVVKYKERLLWNVFDLPQSDSPSPSPET